MKSANNPFAGTGFKGGICACKTKGGRLKRRYTKQAKALEAAQLMPLTAYVYPCPNENGVWHTTTHPRPDGKYITPKKGK
jgi:hypothetical protein